MIFSVSAAACATRYRVLSERELNKACTETVYDNDRQRIVTEAALSLVGRVSYFWGGKYYDVGECPDWGEPRVVTSSGNPATGQELPFGLDCSGYVTWCYAQLGLGKEWLIGTIGDGTWNQWFNSQEITRDEARPGDIAFIRAYPGSSGNHVGIVVGRLHGEPLIAHCSSSENGVVVTTCGSTFVYFRHYPSD